MGIALTILSFAGVCGIWYFTGRNSIYHKLMEDYREALKPTNLKTNQKKRRKKMGNKINIAEILRDCPKGTKLYSPLFGKCEYIGVDNSKHPIAIKAQRTDSTITQTFMKDGRYFEGFEDTDTMIFPSVEMRSWDKFFKRGDVVFNEYSGLVAVFDGWVSDDYTEFNTTINLIERGDFWGEEEVCDTECFTKVTDEKRAEFIAAAEKHYGGKYNPETLQVEPIKVAEPKCPFEPFQKVLVRDDSDDKWKADYFSHYDEDDSSLPYCCVGENYKVCVAYEGNEHLLGTDAPF